MPGLYDVLRESCLELLTRSSPTDRPIGGSVTGWLPSLLARRVPGRLPACLSDVKGVWKDSKSLRAKRDAAVRDTPL